MERIARAIPAMTEERIRMVVGQISHPDYRFRVERDGTIKYLQVVCLDGKDNRTGYPSVWKGRKWPLSVWMTDGEVVQTAFLALMTALEHEAREKFTYKGVTVFDPHYDIDKLVALRQAPDSIQERQDERLQSAL